MRHQTATLQPVDPAYAQTVSPFGPQKGQVGCTEAPGQTCFLKDYGGGTYLCKCFPSKCGSAWSDAPGCKTITWKEPVILPQSVPQPFQSRPPARGRQVGFAARQGNPFCWNDTYCPPPYVCENFECVVPPISAPSPQPQPSSVQPRCCIRTGRWYCPCPDIAAPEPKPTARPSAPRPSTVPRPPPRGGQIPRAALAVR
jgi:hypothetical protein